MTFTINPIANGDLFDALLLDGVKTPGVVVLTGHDRTIGWDVKEGSGQSGATMTRKGEPPVEFTATFALTDGADFDAWPQIDQMFRATIASKVPKALSVYHPDLATNGILSIVLKKFGGVTHDGKGGQKISVTLLEYRPPKPSGGTAAGAKKKVDPNADVKAELARVTEQYARTPWG